METEHTKEKQKRDENQTKGRTGKKRIIKNKKKKRQGEKKKKESAPWTETRRAAKKR